MPAPRPISPLVLTELYESGSDQFLPTLRQHPDSYGYALLLSVIERWKKDSRPWARRTKLEFILGDWPGQSWVIVKRLFKHAIATRDHELVGVCMFQFDGLIRRKIKRRVRWSSDVIETHEVLRLPLLRHTGRPVCSNATRHYVRRGAWRYFRRLGFADGKAYLSAVVGALALYTDDSVRTGANLLDNWGLMHACFGKSPVLRFNGRHTNLFDAGGLSNLAPAPMFQRHWETPDGFTALTDLLLKAQCRPMRVWAIHLLKQFHVAALPNIDPQKLLALLDHQDPDVAAFAADLLSDSKTVSSFPMATWMNLLATRNPMVVATICTAFRKHVTFDRVTLTQAVELTARIATPVAKLGLEILKTKPIRTSTDRRALAVLAAARCSTEAANIAGFAIAILNIPNEYRIDELTAFFDSRLQTMRIGAFAALAAQSPSNPNSCDVDPAFWARLFESPYSDVREKLIDRLRRHGSIPGATTQSLGPLWHSALLNIHRGGRAKLSALVQLSARIVREPESAAVLLPVLAVAMRSVRLPEARHGLAAIVTAVEACPALAAHVARYLPELNLAGAAL